MVMAAVHKDNKLNCTSLFHESTCVSLVHTLLVKATHMANQAQHLGLEKFSLPILRIWQGYRVRNWNHYLIHTDTNSVLGFLGHRVHTCLISLTYYLIVLYSLLQFPRVGVSLSFHQCSALSSSLVFACLMDVKRHLADALLCVSLIMYASKHLFTSC